MTFVSCASSMTASSMIQLDARPHLRSRRCQASPPLFQQLPAEIVAEVLSHLRGLDLVAASSVARLWTPLAAAAAEATLRDRVPSLPRHSTCLNWLRAVGSLDAFERRVGPKPEDHCWWHEWPELRMAETKMAGAPCDSSKMFERGGGGSCSRALAKYSRGIGWMVATGWTTLHAAACLLLGAGGTEAMGHALRTGSTTYAASAHALWESLLTRAAHLSLACPDWSAPPTFACLGGRFGLLVSDPAWAHLVRPGAAKGTSFVTTSLVQTTSDPACLIDPALGFGVACDGAVAPAAATPPSSLIASKPAQNGSDVVVFLSQPADLRSHRSLLLSSPQGYHLPPMAVITLQNVEYPATSQHGPLGQTRRLFVTVRCPF